jgi:alanine dehydrogenase
MKKQTLLLTSENLASLIDEDDAFEAMRKAFEAHGQGKFQMPSKIYLDLQAYRGDFRAMPAYIDSLGACGMKWVNSHPDNLLKRDFPAVMGILILNDPQTGFPLAIMDGTWITRLRTGAAGALASFYLARRGSKILALIGCGAQAEAQLMAHLKQFQIVEVRVWGPKLELADSFKEKMKKLPLSIKPLEKIEDCVQGCDIICTTTPSREPLVLRKWIGPGTHINAIGADAKGKQELDPKILKNSFLVVDDLEQSIHGGEINVPFSQGTISSADIDATLGEIVCGSKSGREGFADITVFDSTGLAIQDMALGHRAYQKALKQGLGHHVSLF